MNEFNLQAIPTAACRLAGGEVHLGDNGQGAKSAPIKLKARSGDSIDHWYWGRVVHDLAGMRVHKPRLTVDYAHNESEVLGYVNNFDSTSGDLFASGALTPWREDDRASEVMFKMREGVPYEASIFFGGDGIKIQEVQEGQVEQVNGRQFEGPGVIIREWPLRGIAICPYGADSNTESVAMTGGETYTAAKWEDKPKEETKMEAENVPVEAEAGAEVAETVEAPTVEAEVTPETDTPEPVLSEHVDGAVDHVAALTAERDGLVVKLQESHAKRDEACDLMAEACNLRDELDGKLTKAEAEITALKAERDEACRKLAAIEAGSLPVSAAPAPEVPVESAWKKAQKKSR